MNLDKISEERLFADNSKEEVMKWCNSLHYFHYMRDRGGHNCEGNSFCAYFKFNDREDLINKLSFIGIELKPLEEEDIPFEPTKSYSFDELDRLKVTTLQFKDLEQPQYTEIFGHKVHVWVLENKFEISVSGTKDGKTYLVSDEDYKVCLQLEDEFDKLNWSSIIDDEIKQQIHCISKEIYPELYR